MQLATQTEEPDQKVSPSTYSALIDSLFQNPAPLFAGGVMVAFAAAMTAVKTGQDLLWPCVAFLVLSGTARAVDMHRYNSRRSALTADEAARWEVRYQIGAMIYAVALGAWCTVALLGSNDAVAHMICLTVTTGYVAGGAGRTYGRPWIFHVQIALACGPAAIALALRGTPYYIGMAVVSAVFFLALRQISIDLQRIFVRAHVAREREAALASQFDTALNNMPHGLCMFGADGRLAVMNYRFSEMMELSDGLVQSGASASDIIAACVSAGSISAASGKIILAEIENSQARGVVTADPDFARNRSLSWTFQPMAGGGAVVLRGRHYRAPQRGSPDQSPGALRRTDGAAEPGQFPRRDRAAPGDPARRRAVVGAAVHRPRPVQAGQRHARPSLRRPAAAARFPSGCARCCGRKTSWRGSAATSSSCSSRTSIPPMTPPVSPGASSIA